MGMGKEEKERVGRLNLAKYRNRRKERGKGKRNQAVWGSNLKPNLLPALLAALPPRPPVWLLVFRAGASLGISIAWRGWRRRGGRGTAPVVGLALVLDCFPTRPDFPFPFPFPFFDFDTLLDSGAPLPPSPSSPFPFPLSPCIPPSPSPASGIARASLRIASTSISPSSSSSSSSGGP